MYLLAVRIALVGLILVLVCTCALADASYRVVEKQGSLLITGSASNIDRLREVMEVTDNGHTYTVLTGRATIHLQDGKMGNTQDLKDNIYVQVAGEQLSARTVLAETVVVLDDRPAPAPRGFQPNDRVESSGSVTGVLTSSKEIDIRTDDGNFALVVRPDTVIRRYIYVTDITDINEGDDISFSGRMGQDGRIVAERIQVSASRGNTKSVSKSYRPTYLSAVSRGREDSIEGTIISPPSAFNRTLRLSTSYGERRVDVLKSAEVRIDQLPASVHDLSKGDSVRVFGTWDGNVMIATRVETYVPSASPAYRAQEPPLPEPEPEPPVQAEPPAQPEPAPEAPAAEEAPAPDNPPAAADQEKANIITGRIVEIDYATATLSVDANLSDNKIDASDAVVTRQGSSRRFSDLKKGDKVEVKGEWNGDVMKAASIDVVE